MLSTLLRSGERAGSKTGVTAVGIFGSGVVRQPARLKVATKRALGGDRVEIGLQPLGVGEGEASPGRQKLKTFRI